MCSERKRAGRKKTKHREGMNALHSGQTPPQRETAAGGAGGGGGGGGGTAGPGRRSSAFLLPTPVSRPPPPPAPLHPTPRPPVPSPRSDAPAQPSPGDTHRQSQGAPLQRGTELRRAGPGRDAKPTPRSGEGLRAQRIPRPPIRGDPGRGRSRQRLWGNRAALHAAPSGEGSTATEPPRQRGDSSPVPTPCWERAGTPERAPVPGGCVTSSERAGTTAPPRGGNESRLRCDGEPAVPSVCAAPGLTAAAPQRLCAASGHRPPGQRHPLHRCYSRRRARFHTAVSWYHLRSQRPHAPLTIPIFPVSSPAPRWRSAINSDL